MGKNGLFGHPGLDPGSLTPLSNPLVQGAGSWIAARGPQ